MRKDNSGCEPNAFVPSRLRSILVCAGLIAAGWLVGSVATRPATAWAEVRNSAPDQHFMAGDQLSLPVLQEISTTLHQMDARLARLEAMADRLAMERGSSAKKNALGAQDAP